MIDYFGEKEATVEAANLTVGDVLTALDKGDGEILRGVDDRRLFISVNNSVVYDLSTQLSNDDYVTLFPIGSGG